MSIVYPNEPAISLAQLNEPWDDWVETSYTLAMLEPDALYRTNAKFCSFRHWVVSCDELDMFCVVNDTPRVHRSTVETAE